MDLIEQKINPMEAFESVIAIMGKHFRKLDAVAESLSFIEKLVNRNIIEVERYEEEKAVLLKEKAEIEQHIGKCIDKIKKH